MLRVLESELEEKAGGVPATLDELAREGARRMLVTALQEEVSAYVKAHTSARDEEGRAQVVRNGRARARKVTPGAGTVEVEASRVHDRRPGKRFTSQLLPPYMRRSPKVDEALPVLYLRGLSTGDFRPALATPLGEDAAGLSVTSITRLTAQWEAEYERSRQRSLEQRDWCYKLANVLDKLPKRLQARAKKALHEVMYAASREQAEEAIEAFALDYGDRHAKAVDCLRKDQEWLLTFFDFPVEHWVHLRTSNVIESTFATVRLRQRVTKGPGSRIKGLTMAYKLLTMAEQRWRRLNSSHLLPVVREGAKFVDGVRVERQDYEEKIEVMCHMGV